MKRATCCVCRPPSGRERVIGLGDSLVCVRAISFRSRAQRARITIINSQCQFFIADAGPCQRRAEISIFSLSARNATLSLARWTNHGAGLERARYQQVGGRVGRRRRRDCCSKATLVESERRFARSLASRFGRPLWKRATSADSKRCNWIAPHAEAAARRCAPNSLE